MDWSAVDYCGFYQLFGLSFWRHPFTAEHSLLKHWCNATFLLIWWRNKLIYILGGLRVKTLSATSHFWVDYLFKYFNINTHFSIINRWACVTNKSFYFNSDCICGSSQMEVDVADEKRHCTRSKGILLSITYTQHTGVMWRYGQTGLLFEW